MIASEVLFVFEDRRVLYNPFYAEVPTDCVESVFQIRQFLTLENCSSERTVTSMNSLAGYDRLSESIPLRPGNFVLTAGLANCIAVAVYNRQIMAMAHFDTNQCFKVEEDSFFDVKNLYAGVIGSKGERLETPLR